MNLSISISPIESFRNFAPFPLDSSLPTNPGVMTLIFTFAKLPTFKTKFFAQTVPTQPLRLAPLLSDKDKEIKRRRLRLKQNK